MSLPVQPIAAIDTRIREAAAHYHRSFPRNLHVPLDLEASAMVGDVVLLEGLNGIRVAFVHVRQANGGFRCSWTRCPS
jgi:hypothetical protein